MFVSKKYVVQNTMNIFTVVKTLNKFTLFRLWKQREEKMFVSKKHVVIEGREN
jgi:hypothetical protein